MGFDAFKEKNQDQLMEHGEKVMEQRYLRRKDMDLHAVMKNERVRQLLGNLVGYCRLKHPKKQLKMGKAFVLTWYRQQYDQKKVFRNLRRDDPAMRGNYDDLSQQARADRQTRRQQLEDAHPEIKPRGRAFRELMNEPVALVNESLMEVVIPNKKWIGIGGFAADYEENHK